jgi:hypothetical protein
VLLTTNGNIYTRQGPRGTPGTPPGPNPLIHRADKLSRVSPDELLCCQTLTRRPTRLKTRIRDSAGRLWFVRTFVNKRVQSQLQPFVQDASAFLLAVDSQNTGFSKAEMAQNARGQHWFSIMGHDRNNKSVSQPALYKTHK